MFNKLHNGNTEALPLIRKEKTIAITILVLVFYQSDDTAAIRQQCFPAVRYMVRQSSYFVRLPFTAASKNKTLSADEDRPTVKASLCSQSAEESVYVQTAMPKHYQI